jgi:hypothetical protein
MKNHGTFTTQAAFNTWVTNHAISSGRPTDIMIGDYLTIGSYKCWIAGVNTEFNKGATALTTPHITLVANFGSSKMNSTDTTEGGYNGASTMQTFLNNRVAELQSVTGTHLLNRSVLLSNTIGGGKAGGWTWTTKKLTLLSEIEFFGCMIFGIEYDVGEAFEKVPLFNVFLPTRIAPRASIWLRAVYNSTNFVTINSNGHPHYSAASNSQTVLAKFCIG